MNPNQQEIRISLTIPDFHSFANNDLRRAIIFGG